MRQGIDFTDTFSPTVKIDSVHVLLTIGAELNYEIQTIDVKNAYVYADLKEEIFMSIPQGMDNCNAKEQVLKLKKGLYGLPQSGREWNKEFSNTLTKLGWRRNDKDPCIYFKELDDGNMMYFALYVDDGLVIAPTTKQIEGFTSELKKHYEIKSGNGSEYLGLEIKRNREEKTIVLRQPGYIERIVEAYGQERANTVSYPMKKGFVCTIKDQEDKPLDEKYPYRSLIGSLMHIARYSRPDITLPLAILCTRMHNPSNRHYQAGIQIIRYLKGTKNQGLFLGGSKEHNLTLSAYSDSIAT